MNQPTNILVCFPRVWVLLLAAIIVAGCGTAPAPAAAPTSAAAAPTSVPANRPHPPAQPLRHTASKPAPVTLTFAFPDDAASSAAALAQIAAYTSEHPKVQVTAKPLPAADYARELLDSVDTNTTDIDLFVSTDSLMPALINRKAALDLQALLAGQPAFKPGDFEPAALAAWQRGSALYGLPTDAVPQVLFYNQDLFTAAGIAAPRPAGHGMTGWRRQAADRPIQR